MTSILNSSRPENYEALREDLRAQLVGALGFEPGGLIVAPCRVEGYHLYSNAGFFTQDRDALTVCLSGDFAAELDGGFVNVRVSEETLRHCVSSLAKGEPAPDAPGMASRLHALLALRADKTAWGEAGNTLAWLLVRGDTPGDYEKKLTEAFEDYFRLGQVDHNIVRAILARMGEKK